MGTKSAHPSMRYTLLVAMKKKSLTWRKLTGFYKKTRRFIEEAINEGLGRTITHLKMRLLRIANRKKWDRILELTDAKDKFTQIYVKKMWKGSESASGFGSGIRYTESLRARMPQLIDRYSIKTVFDAGCGDFNWMQRIINLVDVRYTGADIVEDLIVGNTKKYGNDKTRFVIKDVRLSPIPKSDLVICRDVLFHLSNSDVMITLRNLLNSKSRLYLLTSHLSSKEFSNVDIETGDFRRLDLLSQPFELPTPTLDLIEDWMPPDPPRMMYLYSYQELSEWARSRE